MKIAQVLFSVVTNAILHSGGSTLKWKTVQAWIGQNSSPETINRGYASFNPRTGSTSGNAYVELRKEPKGKAGCRVTASVYFNKRQGAAASTSWEVAKLDSELQKMFGKNLRTRISI